MRTFSSGSSTCIREPRSFERLPRRQRSLPRPINFGRHRSGPLARVRARHRTSGGNHGACPRTCAPGGVAGTGAPYNHTADIGALATDVAFTVPASRAQALREGLVRLQDQLFATRLLRGTVAGWSDARSAAAGVRRPSRAPAGFEKQFDELIGLLVDAGTLTDRVDGTGVPQSPGRARPGDCRDGRACIRVDGDLRRDHPNDAYEGPRFEVPVEEGGDVRARLMVRAREIEQSLVILQQVLGALPDTPLAALCPTDCPPAQEHSGG